MSIDTDTYFKATYGCFKLQPKSWVEKVVDHIKVTEVIDYYEGRSYKYGQTEMKLGNRIWKPNFISYSDKWMSLSAYWISDDGQYLLRVSDHWSKAPKGIKTCGSIKQCYWTIQGTANKSGIKHPSFSKPLWMGIVKLSDMEYIG